MGSKTVSEVVRFDYLRMFRQGDNAAWVTSLNTSQTRTNEFIRVGSDDPRFRQKIKDDQNASGPLSVVIRRMAPVKSSSLTQRTLNGAESNPDSWWSYVANGHYFVPAMPQTPSLNPATDQQMQSQALNKLINKLWKLDHQFQGGVFFGEIVPTLKMLKRPMDTLRKGLDSYFLTLKRRRRGNSLTLRKVLSDTWLEYAFGWQPLLSDVKDACKALERIYHNIPRSSFNVSFRQRAHESSESFPTDDGVFRYNGSFTTESAAEIRYYGRLKHLLFTEETSAATFKGIVALSGFDLRSFAPTAWELVPFSFLVDYFVNVGNVIQSLSLDRSSVKWITQVNSAYTNRIDTFAFDRASTNALRSIPPGDSSGTGSSVKSLVKTITRIPLNGVPYLGLHFDAGINVSQLLNIAALLSGGHVPKPYYR